MYSFLLQIPNGTMQFRLEPATSELLIQRAKSNEIHLFTTIKAELLSEWENLNWTLRTLTAAKSGSNN